MVSTLVPTGRTILAPSLEVKVAVTGASSAGTLSPSDFGNFGAGGRNAGLGVADDLRQRLGRHFDTANDEVWRKLGAVHDHDDRAIRLDEEEVVATHHDGVDVGAGRQNDLGAFGGDEGSLDFGVLDGRVRGLLRRTGYGRIVGGNLGESDRSGAVLSAIVTAGRTIVVTVPIRIRRRLCAVNLAVHTALLHAKRHHAGTHPATFAQVLAQLYVSL